MEEVSIRLLATHLLLDEPIAEVISKQSFDDLQKLVPDKIKALVVKGDYEQTVINLREYKESNYENFIYKLINYDHPFYSSQKISSKVKVRRVQSSDLIDISYNSSDPGICKVTLEILTDVFIEEYTKIKVNQSDAVTKYFQQQLETAQDKLDEAENELLEFNQTNIIINYNEQTKHIAAEKENFDMRYLEIKLTYAGAQSVLSALEAQMSVKQKQRLNNETIQNLRAELAQVNVDIAVKQFEEEVDSVKEDLLINEIAELRAKAYQLEQQLKNVVQEQYYVDNTSEYGVSNTSILDEWINKVIEQEASKAQLKVAELEEKEFEKLYESYAPLGATMKRLERKIDIAEREYLSLLNSLSVAKLNQQNIELTANLRIVTKPLFPIVAQPSKRKFIVVIAFMIGFIIPAFLIILLEFLDQNLKTAQRAEKAIGLNVAAIFPNLNKVSKKLNVEYIKKRSLAVIARQLILNTERLRVKDKPNTNILFSSIDGEGKTKLARLLLEKLAKTGYNVLFLTCNQVEPIAGVKTLFYTANHAFHRVEEIEDLEADFTGVDLNVFDYIFIEIPGILKHSYPINLFRSIDHSFIVTRANRAWSKADATALKDITEFVKDNKPQVLLNGVEMLEMETVLGDLPKKRSRLRMTVKNIFRLQFFTKNKMTKN